MEDSRKKRTKRASKKKTKPTKAHYEAVKRATEEVASERVSMKLSKNRR